MQMTWRVRAVRLRAVAALTALGGTGLGFAGLAAPVRAEAAPGGAASFTVSGGPAGAVTLQPGNPVPLTFTITDTAPASEQISVRATGLFFQGDTAQFSGAPSPNLQVTVAPATVDLAAGASQDVKVTAVAAPGAKPGGLYAGVVFSDVPPSQAGQVNVVTAQGRPLIGHVAGATDDSGRIASFTQALSGSSGSGLSLQASFVDTGNIDYQVGGTVTVIGPTGAIGTATVAPRLVLPGNPRTLPIQFVPPAGTTWPSGQLTAQIHLVWGTTAEHSGDAQTPVQIASGVAAVPSAPAPGQASRPPTFIGRPLTHVHHSPPAGHGTVSASTWVLRFVAILLLLLVLALLLIALWYRRREDEEEARRAPRGDGRQVAAAD
jgi:hypothetical protein